METNIKLTELTEEELEERIIELTKRLSYANKFEKDYFLDQLREMIHQCNEERIRRAQEPLIEKGNKSLDFGDLTPPEYGCFDEIEDTNNTQKDTE